MACLIRVEYAGATYHVMGRGNQGKAIRRVKAGGDPELGALRQRLERAGENQD
jgi:hypothetical protein